MSAMFKDHDTRVLAATHFDQNLVIEAGAGTGKTSLLVERALNLHLSGTTSLRHQIIITFTNKAAAELKVRLAKALSDIAASREDLKTSHSEAGRSYRWLREHKQIDEDTLREAARKALRELELASIHTIHAYCSSILRRHPMEAALPPDYVPDEGEARKILLEEFWPKFLGKQLRKDSKHHRLWFAIFQEFPQEEVQRLAREFVRTPLALDTLLRDGYKTLDPREFYREKHEAYLQQLENAVTQIDKANLRDMVETQIKMLKVLNHAGLEALQTFPEEQIRPVTFWTAKVYSLPKELQGDPAWDTFQADLHAIRKHLKFLYEKLDPRNLEKLMAGLRIFGEQFVAESARIGAPALDDLLLRARNLLRDHSKVREQESQRARAILLDEFQDTDPLQYDIVFLLAGKDGKPKDLIPGRLFIVGDPKQSIYRFRGADIAAYQRTVDQLVACGGDVLSLTTNFRSLPNVLAPLNAVFEPWMGDDQDSPNYEALGAAREEVPDTPGVEVWHIGVEGQANARERREAEARILASNLRRWQAEGRYAFRDMAILFRALTEVSIYTRALREEGIDYVVDGGKMFTNRPEVIEALTLLRALANPADMVATLGVLRSSVGGVSDADLYQFRQAGGQFSWRFPNLSEVMTEAHPSVAQTYSWLKALDKRTRNLPIDRRILSILTEGDFPILMASYFEGAQRVANVKKLAYRAAEMARERVFSLDETVQALEREFGDDYNEGESPLADEAADSVRILSVHAAKGLEFPLVCLADLRPARHNSGFGAKVRVVYRDGNEYLGVSTRSKPDLPSHLAQVEDAEQDKAEGKRLMYVATTRAKDRLVVLLNQPLGRGSFSDVAGSSWNLSDWEGASEDASQENQGVLNRVVFHRAEDQPRPEAVQPIDLSPVYRFRKARELAQETHRLKFRTPSDSKEESAAKPTEVSTSKIRPELARKVGVLVHAALESWDYKTEGDLKAQSQRLLSQVRGSKGFLEEISQEVDAILNGFLGSELRPYLQAQAVHARELPLLMSGESNLETVHGYIDLVYEGQCGLCGRRFQNRRHPESQRDRGSLSKSAHRLCPRSKESPGARNPTPA